ncbi:hypothetical protein IV203_024940 [Nitzschia inconspicua]|uniref:Uncharacterized protein n=1 Tax=Nitzschia inconspicua TaxID=303405 RepID=A0A9K3KA87_9STRA|nr:hypothetical protein IV203_024940 [Nitzschia inconspicua]
MHDCLVALGLLPCRAKPDIWMRKNGELQVWEYIVLCIGDLAIVMQHPRVPIGSLTPKLFEFKLRGIGKISHHLRVQYSQDKDRMLQSQQNKYPKKMTEGYVHFFGSKSRTNACVPLERGDHPETNLRSFLTHWSKVTTSVEKTKATAFGATIIFQQQESVQRQSKKQYTMMCLIYLQALQLGRRLGASYLMCIDSLWDGLLYLERPTGMTREQMGIVLYQYTQTRRMRQQQQQH